MQVTNKYTHFSILTPPPGLNKRTDQTYKIKQVSITNKHNFHGLFLINDAFFQNGDFNTKCTNST